VLPPDILKKYAQVKHSVHNGHFWYIAHDQADAIVAALRDQGFRVDEATFLRGW
jgi:hypothetical protein